MRVPWLPIPRGPRACFLERRTATFSAPRIPRALTLSGGLAARRSDHCHRGGPADGNVLLASSWTRILPRGGVLAAATADAPGRRGPRGPAVAWPRSRCPGGRNSGRRLSFTDAANRGSAFSQYHENAQPRSWPSIRAIRKLSTLTFHLPGRRPTAGAPGLRFTLEWWTILTS
jgi:hypothetical protein